MLIAERIDRALAAIEAGRAPVPADCWHLAATLARIRAGQPWDVASGAVGMLARSQRNAALLRAARMLDAGQARWTLARQLHAAGQRVERGRVRDMEPELRSALEEAARAAPLPESVRTIHRLLTDQMVSCPSEQR
jgi:hypothetical protein